MKHLLLFFLLISISTFSQQFEKVDSLVIKYPQFSKVEDLAKQIDKDFKTDIDKARAAFFWLTKNIRYNLREFNNPKKRSYRFSYSSEEEKIQKLQKVKDDLVAETFRNKTGVCEEYAQSFKKICDLLKIESEVIKGNVRTTVDEIGKNITDTNHAWNAVKIEKEWIVLDATWAAGYEYNNKWIREYNEYFFDIPKNKIFKTHFPTEKIWQIRFGRMSMQDFVNQPIYSNTFLDLKAELTTPKTGIITVKSSENIVLKFKNLDSNVLISYLFKGVRYSQKPEILSTKEGVTLTIQNPKRNTDLVLYINKKDALQFKIVMN